LRPFFSNRAEVSCLSISRTQVPCPKLVQLHPRPVALDLPHVPAISGPVRNGVRRGGWRGVFELSDLKSSTSRKHGGFVGLSRCDPMPPETLVLGKQSGGDKVREPDSVVPPPSWAFGLRCPARWGLDTDDLNDEVLPFTDMDGHPSNLNSHAGRHHELDRCPR